MKSEKQRKTARLADTQTAINRQIRIAKAMGLVCNLKESHRLAKRHALDCGNSECILCHSDKIFRRPTIQERKFNDSHRTNDY